MQNINPEDLKNLLKAKEAILIDVRNNQKYKNEHIPGSINIFSESLIDDLKGKYAKDQKIILYCTSGNRSAKALQKMKESGYVNISHLERGIGQWKKAGYKTEIETKTEIKTETESELQSITKSEVKIEKES